MASDAINQKAVFRQISRIVCANIIVLLAIVVGLNLVFPLQISFSVLTGGLAGIINFYWLTLTIRRSIAIRKDNIKGFVTMRYLIRFSLNALLISYLVSNGIAHPAAFISGFTLIMLNTLLSLVKKRGFSYNHA